jgi:hypothetical protein
MVTGKVGMQIWISDQSKQVAWSQVQNVLTANEHSSTKTEDWNSGHWRKLNKLQEKLATSKQMIQPCETGEDKIT